jgi:hypothetical protein
MKYFHDIFFDLKVLSSLWRMMLCEIVPHIGVTWCPPNIELVLFYPVFDPVEYPLLWSVFVGLCY